MNCVITGCRNEGRHNLSVRLRRPNTSAIWAPNTDGFLCDEHATSGVRITMVVGATNSGTVDTVISAPGSGPWRAEGDTCMRWTEAVLANDVARIPNSLHAPRFNRSPLGAKHDALRDGQGRTRPSAKRASPTATR